MAVRSALSSSSMAASRAALRYSSSPHECAPQKASCRLHSAISGSTRGRWPVAAPRFRSAYLP